MSRLNGWLTEEQRAEASRECLAHWHIRNHGFAKLGRPLFGVAMRAALQDKQLIGSVPIVTIGCGNVVRFRRRADR
jgi:hypothetical protein